MPIERGIVSSVLWPSEYLLDTVPRQGTECVLSLRFLLGYGVRFSFHCAAEESSRVLIQGHKRSKVPETFPAHHCLTQDEVDRTCMASLSCRSPWSLPALSWHHSTLHMAAAPGRPEAASSARLGGAKLSSNYRQPAPGQPQPVPSIPSEAGAVG